MAVSYYAELNINDVELDKSNPRIKMYLENYKEVTSDGIALALNGTASDGSFVALKESIRVNGGVINPILVNHTKDGKYVVIEGNTRLQIYKDFLKASDDDRWKTIRAIVYEDMSEEEIHSIRLQTHLVGPRDWDPYSKAKYLDHLMHEEMLPINAIISYCGGKKNEIMKLVNAYRDMQSYYMPLTKETDYDFDYKDFSKFSELQNKSIIDALQLNGYTKTDFAKWVVEGKIDTAQNVRLLPAVLKDKKAKAEFLKSNLSTAYGYVNTPIESVDLSKISIYELGKTLKERLDKMELKEAMILREPESYDKRAVLSALQSSIEFILHFGSDEEE